MGVVEEKCPNCLGPLRFDPVSGKKCCEFCGASFAIENNPAQAPKMEVPEKDKKSEKERRKELVEQHLHPEEMETEEVKLEGFDFANFNKQVMDNNAEELPIYTCKSCGAEVLSSKEEFSLTCPYCGSNIILTDKISGPLRPNGVIPFRISPAELSKAVNNFYKHKIFLPKNFFSESKLGKVTGVYVPFWVFSGKLSGTKRYYATEIKVYLERGDYERTEESHYAVEADVGASFKDLPVDASNRFDNAMMDSLEPFDLQEAKSFTTDYLQGYAADRFDTAKDDITERAVGRVRASIYPDAYHKVSRGFTSCKEKGGSLQTDIDAQYMLFPVYSFNIHFGGKKYPFTVNGQTGKVVGLLPTDKSLKMRYFLTRFVAGTAVLTALQLVLYFLGR